MKILVAEDEIDYRNALCEALETCGHATVAVSDGVEALALLQRERYDLIISDINMPNTTGTQLHEQVCKMDSLRDVPFIYITGLAILRVATPVERKGLDFVVGKTAFDRILHLVDDLSMRNEVPPGDRIALGLI